MYLLLLVPNIGNAAGATSPTVMTAFISAYPGSANAEVVSLVRDFIRRNGQQSNYESDEDE